MENATTAEKLYNDLDKAITSLVFAKKQGNAEKQTEHENKIAQIIDTVYESNEDIFDCFFRLAIAEYKEKIYWSIYDCKVDPIDAGILTEYDQIFESDDELYDMLYNHYHEPDHYMFKHLKNPYYMFHEMIEQNGKYMIDVRYSPEIANDDGDDCDDVKTS